MSTEAANRARAGAKGVLLLQDGAANSEHASGMLALPALGPMRTMHAVHDSVWSLPAARSVRADRSVQPLRPMPTVWPGTLRSAGAVWLSGRDLLAGDRLQSLLDRRMAVWMRGKVCGRRRFNIRSNARNVRPMKRSRPSAVDNLRFLMMLFWTPLRLHLSNTFTNIICLVSLYSVCFI